jgi:flagellar FliL protein
MNAPRIILLLLVLNILFTLANSALTYFNWNTLRHGASVSSAEADQAPAPLEDPSEYAFFPVQKVIVTLKGENREHYFVLDLVLQTDVKQDLKKLAQLDPIVRNSAVSSLSELSFADLRNMPIAQLQERLEKALNDDFASRRLLQPFQHVLVSKMIVQ